MTYLKVHIKEAYEGGKEKTVKIPKRVAEGYINMTAFGLNQDPKKFGLNSNTDGNGIKRFVNALIQLSSSNVRLYAKDIYAKGFEIADDTKYLLELSLEKDM